MKEAAPIIGITAHRQIARWGFWDREADIITSEYVDSVLEGGGSPVLIPGRSPVAEQVIAKLDGLILSGGPDVDPARYGEAPHPRTEAAVRERDEAELQALSAAVDLGVPVLAVCRGVQLLNVWRGGTLIQHLHDQEGYERHGHGGVFDRTAIAVESSSRLAALVGQTVHGHCHHHQAVGSLGEGLDIVARSADGVVEGVELQGELPVIGVQWHPEESDGDRLIAGFVRTTGSWRSRSSTATATNPGGTTELLLRASLDLRRELEREALADAGLHWTAWRILQLLSEADAMESHDLARLAGITKPTLTGLQSTLARRGFVERESAPNDARRARLRITSAGREVVQATQRSVTRVANGWLGALNQEERRCLTEILRAVGQAS